MPDLPIQFTAKTTLEPEEIARLRALKDDGDDDGYFEKLQMIFESDDAIWEAYYVAVAEALASSRVPAARG